VIVNVETDTICPIAMLVLSSFAAPVPAERDTSPRYTSASEESRIKNNVAMPDATAAVVVIALAVATPAADDPNAVALIGSVTRGVPPAVWICTLPVTPTRPAKKFVRALRVTVGKLVVAILLVPFVT
jgi:hypothetical protein